jgi:DNA-binding NarL/FixJ family response regulator
MPSQLHEHNSSRGPTKLLLVDDQAAARAGLRAILHTLARLEVVGEASNADEAVRCVRDLRPDLAFVDLHLPGLDGVALTRRLKASPDAPRVLIVTLDPSPTRLLAGFRAGADSAWLKGGTRARLAAAIREALRGGPMLPPELAGYLEETRRWSSDGAFVEPLTETEVNVLSLIARAYTRRKIAQTLQIQPGEVLTHVKRVLDKLVVPSEQVESAQGGPHWDASGVPQPWSSALWIARKSSLESIGLARTPATGPAPRSSRSAG